MSVTRRDCSMTSRTVFHVMKRVGNALDELRRDVFFRAGPELRALGRGKRWLYLRAWENMTPLPYSSTRSANSCD